MRFNLTRLLPMLLASCLVMTACDSTSSNDDDPSSDNPSSLVGTWDLVSMQDKEGAFFDLSGETLQAGEPLSVEIDIGGGQTLTASILINGVLTLQTERYTMNMTVQFSVAGQPAESETNTDSGTWSISGNTLTINSDDPEEGGTEVLSVSFSGNTMTLEDDEALMVFEKR